MFGNTLLEKLHFNFVSFYATFAVVSYFVWCDLSFFRELDAEQHLGFDAFINTTVTLPSVKLRMQDHFAHYVFLPACDWLEQTFHISAIPGMSANVVTAIHFVCAAASGRLMAESSLLVQRIAVLVYEVRTLLDTLDGVIYRAQYTVQSYVTGWGTYGFFTDAFADTAGVVFLMLAIFYRLNRNRPCVDGNVEDSLFAKRYDIEKSLLASIDKYSYDKKRFSKQAVFFTIVGFNLLLLCRTVLWDHFNHGYHLLLAVKREDIPREKQWEALGFRSTWFCLWLWKITSADAFMHYTLISILFNKLWKWMRFNVLFGLAHIFIVSVVCQVHLTLLRNSFGVPV